MKKPASIRSLLFTLLLGANVGTSMAKPITTEGVGLTRDAAIRSAMRNAVEQGIGAYVSSETVVKNFMTISDKILSHTDGYVKSYTVASEATEFGVVKVRINAEVESGKLRTDLVAAKLLYELKNKPRIMVLLDEISDGKPMPEKTATHKFEEILLQKEFKVIEPEQFAKVEETEKLKAMGDADLANLAFRQGADLLVKGVINAATPTPKMIYGVQFYSVPIQMNVHIVKADNAQIIATKTKTVKKNSQEAFTAAQFGLSVGGTALAEELIGDLMNYWQSEAYNQNNVELAVTGLAGAELVQAEKLIGGLPFVSAVRLRYQEGRSALYDLDMRATVQDLRDALTKQPPLGLSIVGVTANRLSLDKAGKAGQVSFTYTPATLEITKFSIEDIFPARLRHYESSPLAAVSIKAADRGISDITVSVIIPELMDLPSQAKVARLEAGAERQVPLTVVLKADKVLASAETRTLNGQVTLSFVDNGKTVERKLTAPVKVYDRTAIDWEDGMSIGGFVTYRDATVNALARSAVTALPADETANKGLLQGMAVFQTLTSMGIKYVKDPAGSPGTRALDRVQYPTETLRSLSGDCDDLSTLYAALLSAVGIECAVISYPDHVLIMFNTGIYEKNRYGLSADTTRTVRHKGTLWIPVETTLLPKGFVEAWHVAADEFTRALAQGEAVSITDLSEAWNTYPPVALPASAAQPSAAKASPDLVAETAKLKTSVRADLDAAIAGLKSQVSQKGLSAEQAALLWNRMGILTARSGDPAGALPYFDKAIAGKEIPGLVSNRACALLLAGKEDEALKRFDAVYEKDPSGRVAVDRALCLFVKAQTPAQTDEFIAALRKAAAMMPSAQALAGCLGLDLGLAAETRAAGEHEEEKAKEVNLRRLKELIRMRVLSSEGRPDGKEHGTTSETSTGTKVSGTTTETSTGSIADKKALLVMPFGGIRGADPSQIGKIVDLLYWFEELP
jgi:hypothetical protein